MIIDQTLPQRASMERVVRAGRSWPMLKLLQLAVEFVRAGLLLRLQFPRMQRDEKLGGIQRWASRILQILEIEVECNKLPPAGFVGLVVANHLSWLDVLVIQSLMPGVFVAKSEVRNWPLIGAMARACTTIFVDRRSARSAHAMVDSTVAAFEQGYAVIAFPEGTSSEGADLGSFHANIFEGAIRAATDVQTVTLRYVNTDTGSPAKAAVFIGETTLLSSLRKVLGTSTIKIKVHIGKTLYAPGQTRRSLSTQAHRHISAQLAQINRTCFHN